MQFSADTDSELPVVRSFRPVLLRAAPPYLMVSIGTATLTKLAPCMERSSVAESSMMVPFCIQTSPLPSSRGARESSRAIRFFPSAY